MELRSILRSPLVYTAYQHISGGVHMRDISLGILGARPGHRVLDVGCGPAFYLAAMPEVEYHGFDTDARYIEQARQRFGHRAQFYCEPFLAEHAQRLGRFDRVLLMGLLHHLCDEECDALLALVASVLQPGGLAVALDTAYHADQSRFESALAAHDRGQYVRPTEGFTALADRHFESVEGRLSSAWWVPSTFWLMTLKSPRQAAASDAGGQG